MLKFTEKSPTIKLKNQPNLGVFIKCSNMFGGFIARYSYIDVMTYTIRPTEDIPVRRLIVGNKEHYLKYKGFFGIYGLAEEIKYFPSLHSKLYICYKEGRFKTSVDVFVGSANLCTNSMTELLVRVNKKQGKFLTKYFEEVWKTLP